jgi:hypothetical protein
MDKGRQGGAAGSSRDERANGCKKGARRFREIKGVEKTSEDRKKRSWSLVPGRKPEVRGQAGKDVYRTHKERKAVVQAVLPAAARVGNRRYGSLGKLRHVEVRRLVRRHDFCESSMSKQKRMPK